MNTGIHGMWLDVVNMTTSKKNILVVITMETIVSILSIREIPGQHETKKI